MSSLFNTRLFHQMFSGCGRNGNDLNVQIARRVFKLADSQIRSQEKCHNAGWFDQNGNKLGWGDLVYRDFLRIMENVHPFDTFIITGESAHCLVEGRTNQIVDSGRRAGSHEEVGKWADRDFVIRHARYAIFANQIFWIYDEEDDNTDMHKVEEDGSGYHISIEIWPMSRAKLAARLEEQMLREAFDMNRRRDELLKRYQQGLLNRKVLDEQLRELGFSFNTGSR